MCVCIRVCVCVCVSVGRHSGRTATGGDTGWTAAGHEQVLLTRPLGFRAFLNVSSSGFGCFVFLFSLFFSKRRRARPPLVCRFNRDARFRLRWDFSFSTYFVRFRGRKTRQNRSFLLLEEKKRATFGSELNLFTPLKQRNVQVPTR